MVYFSSLTSIQFVIIGSISKNICSKVTCSANFCARIQIFYGNRAPHLRWLPIKCPAPRVSERVILLNKPSVEIWERQKNYLFFFFFEKVNRYIQIATTVISQVTRQKDSFIQKTNTEIQRYEIDDKQKDRREREREREKKKKQRRTVVRKGSI